MVVGGAEGDRAVGTPGAPAPAPDAPGGPSGTAAGAPVPSAPRGRLLSARKEVGRRVFGTVPEGSIRRRASDVTRVLLALTGLLLLLTVGRSHVVQGSLLARVSGLLEGREVVSTTRVVGQLLAAAVPVVLALVTGRRRLAATLALAVAVAWGVTELLEARYDVAGARRAASTLVDGRATQLPSLGTALAVAAASAVGPFLTRPSRRLVSWAAATVPVAAVLGGVALPVDVVAGVLVGWGAAAAVHLLAGSPAGTPTVAQVDATLGALGVPSVDVALASRQVTGHTRFTARHGELGTPLWVEVYGRDEADTQQAATLYRAIAFREQRRLEPPSRRLAVEQEAYHLLLAERAGVPVPSLVTAGVGGPSGDALLVTEAAVGTPLHRFDAEDVHDDLLDEAWSLVVALRTARLSHGLLDASNVVVRPSDPPGRRLTLVDLRSARAQADDDALDLDAVALLASTAALVGASRAVDAARRALGDDALAAVTARCQPAALARSTRAIVPDAKALLAEVRTEVADRTGAEAPELVKLRRVSLADIAMVALTLFGVSLIVRQFTDADDVWAELASATPAWVATAFVLSLLTNFSSALALAGAMPVRLPLASLTATQIARAFTGIVGGTTANTALIMRFCQKRGIPAVTAVSSGVLVSIGSMLGQVVLVLVAIVLGSPELSVGRLTEGASVSGASSGTARLLIIGAVLAVVVLVGAAIALPRLRTTVVDRVRPQVRELWNGVRSALTDGRRAAAVVGGNVATQILFALTLWASLHAYGAEANLATLVLVNTFASLLAGISPVPGGMGVMEAGIVAGLTAAGVPSTEAVAATLTHRLFTTYLPPIWGWFALAWLRRRDEL